MAEAPSLPVVTIAIPCFNEERHIEACLDDVFAQDYPDKSIEVLVGDPGRRYLPTDELSELATYEVRTTTELEDLDLKQGRVYALRPPGKTA